jgi:hypothetical protein
VKYRLEDGRIVRRPALLGGSREVPRIIETIPEFRDRFHGFPFASVVALGLVTVSLSALVVGVSLEQGWRGALNGAYFAAFMFVACAFIGSYITGGVFKNDEVEERTFWRVLIPWAVLTVVVTAWLASERPWQF